jgi:membrane-associated phospholipid phosphatase
MHEYWMIPYVSWVFYIVAFCLSIKNDTKKFIRLATGLVVVHALIFIFYPVEFPRNYDLNSLCAVNKFLLNCDNPQNCLPSLHVSLIFLTLLSAQLLGISKKMRYFFIIWGMIIMISVIFVKQHYIIDVMAGIIVTTIYFYLFFLFKDRLRGSF